LAALLPPDALHLGGITVELHADGASAREAGADVVLRGRHAGYGVVDPRGHVAQSGRTEDETRVEGSSTTKKRERQD